MAKPEISYSPDGRDAFTCTLTTSRGSIWTVTGKGTAPAPDNFESTVSRPNPWMGKALWGYGKLEWSHRRSRKETDRESLRKEADKVSADVSAMGELLDRKRRKGLVTGWCSACFTRTRHSETTTRSILKTFVCTECGSPTVRCAEPRCRHLAAATPKSPGIPRYCAEHRHEIPSFATLSSTLTSLDEVAGWMEYKSPNRARQSKILALGAGSAAVLLPVSLAAAPLVGGAIGSSFLGGGLAGAAATSHGLALLGGGSIAAGGFGMAGGTMVVGAVGSALGGAMGAAITIAYVGADKSFRFERLRSGKGPAVIVINGFLTEATESWGPWERIITERYPGQPVYRVHWGAKELRALGTLLGGATAKQAGLAALRYMSLRASKAATTASVAGVLALGDVAKNPWSVARNRAISTGLILADVIARIPEQQFILVGHSLGGLAAITAAEALGTKSHDDHLAEVHLLGAAASPQAVDWRLVSRAVSGDVYNYFSTNDAVLNNLFRAVRLGEKAIGANRLRSHHANIRDRDVSRVVPSHGDYFFSVRLVRASTN